MSTTTKTTNPILNITNDPNTSTSYKIRTLHNLGFTKSQISQMVSTKEGTNIRYQHVRNVLLQQLKRS